MTLELLHVHYAVICDHPGCGDGLGFDLQCGGDIGETIAIMGWTVKRGPTLSTSKYYCPRHSKEAEE